MTEMDSAPDLVEKKALYRLLNRQMSALMEGENHPLPNMANMSALLYEALPDINWAGFYLCCDGGLMLGPFQGKTACIRIPIGKGVCGTAAETCMTQLVPDVHAFPGHIACDGVSRSEIVIPLQCTDGLIGVLDIDSPRQGRFDELDQDGLQQLAKQLEAGCDWSLMTF